MRRGLSACGRRGGCRLRRGVRELRDYLKRVTADLHRTRRR
ncbi:polyketide synthase docking domain-containing protein, partial [Streptomyces cavourensis]|nr:polyketide synthase docking domain-containing protein [Streptomyces cavourensis]